MAELTREEQAKAAQRAYMRKYSQRPEVRERKRQANIDFWARRYAKMTEEEKREAEKTPLRNKNAPSGLKGAREYENRLFLGSESR